MNLLSNISPGRTAPFAWEHEPERWEVLPGGGVRIHAFAGANYFRDPGSDRLCDAAPYLWLPVEGDFVARLHTRPHFQSTYDSGCLLVRHDASHWVKLCYESTDFGSQAIVSVVTDGWSDDANGVDLTVPDVWLQIARVDDCFGLHYALDGQNWRMVRYLRLDVPPTVRVGIVAQCPVGPGSVIDFPSLTLEHHTVANLRAGV